MKKEPPIQGFLGAEDLIINDEILEKYKLSIDESKIDVFDIINFITTLEE